MGLLQSLQGFLGITANRERKKAEENLARANAKMASTPAKYGVLKDDRRRQSFAQGNTLTPYRSPYSQILDQYNPLDNGRTMANPIPQNSLSSAKQLLGIANSFKESMAQPYRYVGDASGRAIDYATGGKLDEATRRLNESNALLTKTYADLRKARYQPRNLEQAIKENALNQSKTSRKIDTETQATIDATNKRRFLASVGEIGFDVATVGTGATAAKGTRTALNQAVKTGALQGGTSGAFSGLGQKEVTPQSILASTGMGVAFGGALPVAGYGLKVGGKKLISGVNGLDDAGSIPINKGAVGKNVNKGVGDPLESLKGEAKDIKTRTIKTADGKNEYVAQLGNKVTDRVGRETGFKATATSPNFKSEGEMQKWISQNIDNQSTAPKTKGVAPQPTKTDPLDSLKAEARKYKSAEEFVKAQGNPLYHGSTENIDSFDLNHLNQTYMHNGLGVNFTENQDFAKLYSRGKNQWGEINKVDNGKGFINERLTPGAKVLDLTKGDKKVSDVLSFDNYKKLASSEGVDIALARKNLERNARNILMYNTDSLTASKKAAAMSNDELLKLKYDTIKDKALVSGEGLPDMFRAITDVSGMSTEQVANAVKQFSKLAGSDVIKSTKENGSVVHTVLNPDVLKTKAQLTDLYNQAKTVAPVESKGVVTAKTPTPTPKPKKQVAFNNNAPVKPRLTGLDGVTGRPPKIPTVKQAVSGAPTVADRTDQIYKTLGVDTQEGLVKGNFLYNNPVVSTYNRAQQGIRNYIDSVSDAGVSKYEQALNSNNAVIAGAARTPRGVFNNVGRSEAARTALTKRTSSIEMSGGAAKAALKDINEVVAQMPDQSKHFKRIYQVLEDGDFLQKVYGSRKKVSASKLNPQEKVAFNKLVELNKIRNDINLETGQITKAFHDKYTDGLHSPRVYDLKAKKANKNYGSGFLDDSASKQRKDILMMDEKITSKTLENPYLASVGRLELALRNKADLEALADLSKANQIFNYPPNKNFIKLGERYGKYKGKYVDKQLLSQLEGKDYFNTSIGQGTGDWTRKYAQSPLGQADKTMKTTKTALAPAVGVGNVSSNIVAFSGAANVNPATTAVRMAQAGKQLYKASKGFDSNVYRAEKAGLFSGNTGKQLLGLSDTEVAIRAKSSKNPVKAAASLYGNTDRAAALGLFNELKARGLSDAKAVRRVHSAMQNYDNAGRAINTLADAPILGKPFARFSPELIRIAKNNLKYNPVGTAVKVGGLATGLTALSKKVGETEEERKAREEAVGQTQLPGTRLINKVTGGPDRNVSLNAAIGDSSVNASRLLGLNFPIEPGGNSNTSLVRQLSPLADFTRTTADGKEVFAPNQAVSSLLFKPIADQLANRDFMGRQISDPENKVRSEIGAGKSQFENADGTRQSPGKAQEIRNRLKALGGGYIPGFQEFNSIYSSQKGEKDLYGKVRTPAQGILRAGGLKVESNDKDAREKRVSNADFFEGKDKQVKQFLKDNPGKANDYFKFNDSSRDRFTNKKSSGLVTPEKWSIIKAQTDNKLFNQLKQEALDENTKSKKPIDPIFKLDTPAKVKEAISIRSMNPGENVEREEILRATTKWYKKYEDNERKYYKANSAFFDKIPKSDNPSKLNDRVKKWVDVPYTEQTKLASKYLTLRYGDKEKGIKPNEQAGKDFYKANADQLSKDFSSYKDARLKEINAKRAIMNLKPLDKKVFNNVTFGYEDDEDKVATQLYFKNKGKGKGYGKGSGSGKSKSAKYSSAYSDIIADIGSLNKKTSKLKVKGSNLKVKKTALKTYTVAKNKGVT